jgi:hypothetical protein
MTMKEYYCYQFHFRKNQPNPFLCYRLLSSQAKVDTRACIDCDTPSVTVATTMSEQ